EAREKLSQLAKKRHAEGRFGGPKFGRMGALARKQNRVSRRVVAAAQEEETAKASINVFRDAISPDQPISIRLRAAEAWMNVEREEMKLQLQEDESAHRQHSREELINILSQKLTSGLSAQILRRQIESETGVTDADVVDADVEVVDVA